MYTLTFTLYMYLPCTFTLPHMYTQVSRSLEQFDVQEKSSTYLTQVCPNVTVWMTLVEVVDPTSHSLHLTNGSVLNYDKLCICTGGRPKVSEGNTCYYMYLEIIRIIMLHVQCFIVILCTCT